VAAKVGKEGGRNVGERPRREVLEKWKGFRGNAF